MTYQEYLQKRAGIPVKQIPYFQQWVTKYHQYESLHKINPSTIGFERSLLGRFKDW